jgi:hypothetical protein
MSQLSVVFTALTASFDRWKRQFSKKLTVPLAFKLTPAIAPQNQNGSDANADSSTLHLSHSANMNSSIYTQLQVLASHCCGRALPAAHSL